MIIHQCDSCGEEYEPRTEGQGGCAVALAPPRKPKAAPHSLVEWLNSDHGMDEVKFDLCRECALALMVSLKQRKLDREQGRSVFSA